MLIENKDYKTRNGKIVYNIFKRNTMTDENVFLYVYEWLKKNKDSEILKDEIVYKVSSGARFPFIGVLFLSKEKKWLITNWTIEGKYDTSESPNDLISFK